MNRPHLTACLVALSLLGAAVVAGLFYARRVEGRYIHALATELFEQKNQGGALQAEAFRQADLLPLYGSSELGKYPSFADPIEFFRTYPTGFSVFPVGNAGATSLSVLQALAAVGPELRGKKLVLSITPGWLVLGDAADPDHYAGNFSRLHAVEMIFNSDLGPPLKRAVARRMLEFPDTLDRDPLLKIALEALADGSLSRQALFCVALPLGKLEALVLRLQDHWETLGLIRSRPDLAPDVPRQAARLDWPSLLALAEREAQQRADNNPFGFDSQYWDARLKKLTQRQVRSSDQAFLESVQGAVGWSDLDLLLRGLSEAGARPLILSAPIKGVYSDYWGVSARARSAYYLKLRAVAEPYGVPVLDFADHDEDMYFVADHFSHPSQKGWIYYDRALDAFYHGRLD